MMLTETDPMVDLGPVRWGGSIVGRVFLASWPDEPVSVDGEAVAFDQVPLGRLADWVEQRPVCVDSVGVVLPLLLALADAAAEPAPPASPS